MSGNGEKVLVAMSGGVDSAVAALLLKEQGYDVVGVHLRLWEYDESCDIKVTAKSCCSPEEVGEAAFVAQRLAIPFYVIKMEEQFRKTVIDDFIETYQHARTPNPCVNCNTFVKFGELFDKARQLGISKIATGHYARVVEENGRYAVKNGLDTLKNQAYYLYGLSQEALACTLFPLGEMHKSEVREIAARHDLPVASKPESQDICFIPNNDYRSFLKKQGVVFQPGRFINTSGEVLGHHDGKEKFTVGQRKGLGLALNEPVYVKAIKTDGDVVVAFADEMDESVFQISRPNFMLWPAEDCSEWHEGLVQLRSRHNAVACRFRMSGDRIEVNTRYPEPAITPGQSAVIFRADDEQHGEGGSQTVGPVIVGGLIEKAA